jgi:hypothetical protein
VDDVSVNRPKAIEQATDIADHRLHAGAMALATFDLHVDDD